MEYFCGAGFIICNGAWNFLASEGLARKTFNKANISDLRALEVEVDKLMGK